MTCDDILTCFRFLKGNDVDKVHRMLDLFAEIELWFVKHIMISRDIMIWKSFKELHRGIQVKEGFNLTKPSGTYQDSTRVLTRIVLGYLPVQYDISSGGANSYSVNLVPII